MSPSQNTGAEIPMRTNPIAARSAAVRRLTAESTPIDTPRMSQMMAAPKNEQQRPRRPFLHLLEDGNLRVVRVTQSRPAELVAGEEVLDELPVLLVPRLIQAQAFPDERERLFGRGLPGKAQGRVARRAEVEDRVREQEDDENDHPRPEDPPGDVESHRIRR